MSVKIDKSSSSLPLPLGGEGKARASNTKSGDNASPTTPSGTNVNLGTSSAQLRSIESSTLGTPLVNTSKVAEIKQAISEGRFQVNSGAVADSLIRSVTDLIASQQT